MDYVLGVDIGTTHAKALAFDTRGTAIGRKDVGYSMLHSKPHYSEQDPDEIFKAVLAAIRDVVSERSQRNDRLLAISFSAAMHSLVALDKRGTPLTRLIIWADTRSAREAEQLRSKKDGTKIYLETGTPIHPMSPLCKLLWLKKNEPQIFSKAHKFVSMKEYVFFKLFGSFVVDYGIASATGLFNIFDLTWSKRALRYLGLDAKKLSDPVSPLKAFFNPQVPNLPVASDVAWILGGSDGCLANLGTNAIRNRSAALTIGTSGAIRVISNKPKSDKAQRIFSYILDEKHFVLGGPVNNGGIVLQWFRDRFASGDPYEALIADAEKIPPGSDGLLFLPYLLGERAPHWDAHARGVYFGININHGRDHFLRAALEGTTFGLFQIGKSLEEIIGAIDEIFVTGGIVATELWLQMIADVFDKKVSVAPQSESSCFGAAILALKAMNILKSIEEVANLAPITKTYYPDSERHRAYLKNFEIFEGLYEKLKPDFKKVSQLQESLCLS